MRTRPEVYQMHRALADAFPHLHPAHQRGLALWVVGTLLAHSCCLSAVLAALAPLGRRANLREQLRETLCDGTDKRTPCQGQWAVDTCFAPLLRWLLRWWQGDALPLALDATTLHNRVVVLAVSVLYRGTAIPIAWHILPAYHKEAWRPHFQRLLALLAPTIPTHLRVIVLTDRGLGSPDLWRTICDAHWHPLMRVANDIVFQPQGERRRPARTLIAGPGHAWVGGGIAFHQRRRAATLIVVWAAQERECWMVLTDLDPQDVGVAWYGLRVWVELGFRVLKSVGWQWQRSQRIAPERITRHWLVLAIATLWTVAVGTRVEEAERRGIAPTHLHQPTLPPPPHDQPRRVSLVAAGHSWLVRQLVRGRLWTRLWLTPEPWPEPPPDWCVDFHTIPP